jgi:hypothetical protein
MTSHDPEAPDPRLAARLAALPREAVPPAGTWSRVLAAERARRRTVRWRLGAAAGLVVAMSSWALTASRREPPPPMAREETLLVAAVLPEEARDPRWHATVQELEAWHAAAADPRRSAGWPSEAREAVLAAVRDTEAELAAVRAAISAHSAHDAQRARWLDHLATLRAQQLDQLQRARALLDQL